MAKIIIASDSFKGCVSSADVADSAAAGIKAAVPGCTVVKIPVGDGGEGTTEAVVTGSSGIMTDCTVAGPLMGPVRASYGIIDNGKTAIIEMASCAGLTLIPADNRNPMLTTTYGVGQMIAHALDRGCVNFLICLGGSSTNDAGIGMLSALGYRFTDSDGNALAPCGGSLAHIAGIDDRAVNPHLKNARFTAACDVINPFYGPQGAAHVFAPQKGADSRMVDELDNGLRNFADIIKRTYDHDISTLPGAGAAGGLGGGLVALLGATLMPGITMVLDAIGFDEAIAGADLVITGEGRLDSQTIMGKTPYGILQRCRAKNIPVIAIGGAVTDADTLIRAGFAAVLPILPYPVPGEKAMEREFTKANIERTVCQAMRLININHKTQNPSQQ